MLHHDITELIGDTPLLHLQPERHGIPGVELYAKLELFNPFGSVKDRVAWGMARAHLGPMAAAGQRLIEASSGNTGKALQILAGMAGVEVDVLANRTRVPEVRELLMLLGATLEELPGLSECPDPTVPNDVFSVIEGRMAADPGRYRHLSQYTNPDNLETHYDTTGREIHDDLGPVDTLFGGLGTAGSTRGVASHLRDRGALGRLVGVVSASDDFIPGIRSESELWEVGLFQRDAYDAIVTVGAGDAIDAAVDLCRRHGVLGGPTSGATYAAVRHWYAEHPVAAGRSEAAVLIVCDRIEPYLSYIRARRPELVGAAPALSLDDIPADDVAGGPVVTPVELSWRLQSPGIVVVDTRGEMAYRVAHVPGSFNVRDDVLVAMAQQGCPFAPPLEVVLVCPIGMRSLQLAALLRRVGCRASALDGGLLAWRATGLPLGSTSSAP